ncbi:MAG: phycobilisome rod-core linker polypeptide, partial [Cyanobacteria bacterium MAG IRC1_bin_28]|nr:phycobilisome rod-core linker polypeptide [Cyanobacteria bacterium MAG IRC1_bin_28]
FQDEPEGRRLVVDCFNVLLTELSESGPSPRLRPGSVVAQGLQLPATYAEAAASPGRYVMRPGLSGREKAEVVRAAYRQVLERDVVKAYSLRLAAPETDVRNGRISMREFVRSIGRSSLYRRDFYSNQSNSRVVELAFRHFLGRGVSTLEEFRQAFAVVSSGGQGALVDFLVDSDEYGRIYGEETVPYLRDLGEEAQESANWGPNRKLFNYAARFQGSPQYVTSFSGQRRPLPDQHAYGGANDPLANQYGAIFPSSTNAPRTLAAGFGYDSRRLFVGSAPGLSAQMGSADSRKPRPTTSGPKVVRLQQVATGGASIPRRGGQPSIRCTEASTQAVVAAVYRQVLGTLGYEGERLSSEEIKLENGDITLREFVRVVARSNRFRKRYWDGLYVVKAIEVIHRRLLGRPTYGRWEIDAYFDVASREGFYGIVNAMLDSQEYNQVFGDDTVPYERYITPTDRVTRQVPGLRTDYRIPYVGDTSNPLRGERRPERRPARGFQYSGALPRRGVDRVRPFLAARITVMPPVASPRFMRGLPLPRKEAVSLTSRGDSSQLQQVIRAAYRQVLGNIQPMESERLTQAESQLANGTITVRQFVREIALSNLYRRRYFEVCNPQQFVAFNFRHLLGRPPANQQELAVHARLVAEKGVAAEVDSYLDSDEYLQRFGEDAVPYSVEDTLPRTYNTPSFTTVFAGIPAGAQPDASTVSDVEPPPWTAKVSDRAGQPDFLKGVPMRNLPTNLLFTPATGLFPALGQPRRTPQPVKLRLSPKPSQQELTAVINAAYRQLLGRVPLAEERLTSAESQLRSGRITAAGFIAQVSASSLFQSRLSSFSALKAADAAYMALQGRSPSQAEASAFADQQARLGKAAAIAALLDTPEYKERFGDNTVPVVEGTQTFPGRSQAVITRTARLDGGPAGITPRP